MYVVIKNFQEITQNHFFKKASNTHKPCIYTSKPYTHHLGPRLFKHQSNWKILSLKGKRNGSSQGRADMCKPIPASHLYTC